MERDRISGAVLAGGRSSRFGSDKALLELNGQPLLTRVARVLADVAAEVLVLGPPERATLVPSARVISDERPGGGPLPAIVTALREMTGDRAFVVATDMPLLNLELIRYLLGRSDGYDVTVPRVGGRTQQLHAVYSRACLPAIETQLARDDLKIDRFFAEVRTLVIEEDEIARLDPEFLSFRNINTEEDWEDLRRLAVVKG